jgi:beta-phosphoglucomutase
MIRAMIFDLDGTLVQTERLKALSYARAAVELCPHAIDEAHVIEAFKDVVGLSRREVATTLVEQFNLNEKAHARMAEFGVDTAWQAYVQVRLQIYTQMLADPDVIRKNQWPHNVSLLQEARRADCTVGLATMSFCPQVRRVLEILDMTESFDFIATRDDVEHGKPDPEIYLLVASQLGVQPFECMVIEDSPTGVKAALNAGMSVIAVSTPFTRKRLYESALLPETHIVDDPARLPDVVAQIIKEKE